MLVISPALAHQPSEPPSPITKEAAITYLQDQATKEKRKTHFEVIDELVATKGTRKAAAMALREAPSAHGPYIAEGITERDLLTGFLLYGGLVIAEYEPETRKAVMLHLVTKKDDTILDSTDPPDFYGTISVDEIQGLLPLVKHFTSELYAAPNGSIQNVYNNVFDGHVEENSYFGYSKEMFESVNEAEIQPYLLARASITFKAIRYSVALPGFANDPGRALTMAAEEVSRLGREFMAQRGLSPDSFHELVDTDRKWSSADLARATPLLVEMNSYMDRALAEKVDLDVFEANRLLATMPLQFEVIDRTATQESKLYCAGFLAVFAACWERRDGKFVFAGMADSI